MHDCSFINYPHTLNSYYFLLFQCSPQTSYSPPSPSSVCTPATLTCPLFFFFSLTFAHSTSRPLCVHPHPRRPPFLFVQLSPFPHTVKSTATSLLPVLQSNTAGSRAPPYKIQRKVPVKIKQGTCIIATYFSAALVLTKFPC